MKQFLRRMATNKPLGDTKVFQPIKVGRNQLAHRVAYAPTTRVRNSQDHVPTDLMLQYYDDRTQTPGSLIVAEATLVAERAGLMGPTPGIWNQTQIDAWKLITDKVHDNGCFISCQLWNQGRTGSPKMLKAKGYPYVLSSPIYWNEDSKKEAEECGNPLRELTEAEIDTLVTETYPEAARNAIAAGFDYVELHLATGYIFDQFLQDLTNHRTDQYGGSIENRARFLLRAIDSVVAAVGADRVAVRFSPYGRDHGMGGDTNAVHPLVQYGYVLGELQHRADNGNQLAYVSVVGPRSDQTDDVSMQPMDWVPAVWRGTLVRALYSYDMPDWSEVLADTANDRTLVAFARYYTSNPDLPERLRNGTELEHYQRQYFFSGTNWGYNSYVAHGKEKTAKEEDESKRMGKPLA